MGKTLKLLIPLSSVYTYWTYLNKEYHKKVEKIVDKYHTDSLMSDDEHLQASKNIKLERGKLIEPKPKDVIPLLIFSLTAHFIKKQPYASILGSLIAQFALR